MKWKKINPNKLPLGLYLCRDINDVTEEIYCGYIRKDKDGVYVETIIGMCQPVTHYMCISELTKIEFE